MVPYMSLGAVIRKARTSVGMTQVTLAAKVGVDPSTASRWERNAATPSMAHVIAIANACGVPIAAFVRSLET